MFNDVIDVVFDETFVFNVVTDELNVVIDEVFKITFSFISSKTINFIVLSKFKVVGLCCKTICVIFGQF